MRETARRFDVVRVVLAAALLVSLAMPGAAWAQTKPAASGAAKPVNVPQTKPPTTKTGKEAVDINLGAYVELLRSDVRSQKIAILTELMDLTEAQDKAFWPIYREYDRELTTLSDERVANILEYSKNYPDVSDAVADKLILKAIDIQARRGALLAKYYERMKQAITPKTAAKFIQIEHQLLALIDLQISASLPIVE
jgi:Spy/CpxP family protein refolding chaperone